MDVEVLEVDDETCGSLIGRRPGLNDIPPFLRHRHRRQVEFRKISGDSGGCESMVGKYWKARRTNSDGERQRERSSQAARGFEPGCSVPVCRLSEHKKSPDCRRHPSAARRSLQLDSSSAVSSKIHIAYELTAVEPVRSVALPHTH